LSIENTITAGLPVTEEVFAAAGNDFAPRRDLALMQIARYGADLRSLGEAAINSLGVIPAKKNVRGWAGALREMKSAHVTPEHVKQATQKLLRDGMTVTDIFSIKGSAISLAAKRDFNSVKVLPVRVDPLAEYYKSNGG
jgi:hypothetical protein